jgi:hypothetical protein
MPTLTIFKTTSSKRLFTGIAAVSGLILCSGCGTINSSETVAGIWGAKANEPHVESAANGRMSSNDLSDAKDAHRAKQPTDVD